MDVHTSNAYSDGGAPKTPDPTLYVTEDGYDDGGSFVRAGTYKIQAISIEQQQSDLFEFKIISPETP